MISFPFMFTMFCENRYLGYPEHCNLSVSSNIFLILDDLLKYPVSLEPSQKDLHIPRFSFSGLC